MAGLEAKLRITAQDEAGAAFKQIKDQISALDKSIATFDKLGAAAAKVGRAADPMITSINRSTSALDAQKAAVSALSEKLASSAGSAEEAASGQRALGEATAATTRILIAQGAEAANVAGKLARVQEQAVKGARGAKEKEGFISGAAGGIGGMIVGAGLIRSAEDMAKDAAELEQRKFDVREASKGDPTESPFAEGLAAEIAARYPNITEAEALKTYKEMRANSLNQDATLNRERMRSNLMAASKAQTAALALNIPMEPNDIQDVIKVVEGTGRANDPAALDKVLDLYIKGKQQLGSALTADKMRDFVQNAKAANFSLSDAELVRNMVRMTEGNASRLGTEIASTMATLVGGHMLKQTGQWLVSMGLAKGFIEHGKEKGKIYGLKDRGLAEVSQLEWANEILLPALVKHHVASEPAIQARMKMLRASDLKHDPNAKIDENVLHERAESGLIAASIMQSGVKQTVADNLAHVIVNEHLIERDSAGIMKMSGSDAAGRIGENPIAAFAEFTHSIENFGAVVVAPAVAKAGPILDELAHGVAALAEAAAAVTKKYPALTGDVGLGAGVLATGTGASLMGLGVWKTLKWLTGFGGKSAAGAEGAAAGAAGAAAPAVEGWLATLGRLGSAVLAPASLIFGAASGNEGVAAMMRRAHPDSSDESVRAWAAALSAPTGAAVRAPWPNQIQDMARSVRAEQEFRRDPEAARGRAMHDMGQTKSTVVGVQGSAQVDQTLHLDVSVPPWLEAKLEQLTNFNFTVPMAPVGRMDSDAAPSHGIGHM